jgi:hypothetical protein
LTFDHASVSLKLGEGRVREEHQFERAVGLLAENPKRERNVMSELLKAWIESNGGLAALSREAESRERDEVARLRLGEARAVLSFRRAQGVVYNLNHNVLKEDVEDFGQSLSKELMGKRVLDGQFFSKFCERTLDYMRKVVGRREDMEAEWEEMDRLYPAHLTEQMWFKFDIPYSEL